ncbi:MAG: hypothetical protein PWQ27_931 [Kosmotoga sp.]|nr:hypothetical protein [Kosmotoga sp.]MDK2953548.1 hypothetical protein [Kosmotoga sp.]
MYIMLEKIAIFSIFFSLIGIFLLLSLLFIQPLAITEESVVYNKQEEIDLSLFEKNLKLENYFQPLFAKPEEVIQSLLEIGVEATSLAYKSYIKLNDVNYAVIEVNNQLKTVRVGDFIAPYIVYGITEFAVLLNDTRSNTFAIVKFFQAEN